MNPMIFRVTSLAMGLLTAALLGGCGSVSDLTKEHVARSETSVQQAQQAIGNSESGALELQRARDNAAQARQALNDKDGKKADRFATQAQLDAELATAKSQSASARRAADDVLASIQTLREEAARGAPPSNQ
jgi:uncharacterized protein YceK